MTRLTERIQTGTLDLCSVAPAYDSFAFYIGTDVLGLLRIRSVGPTGLRLLRAWNASKTTFDPGRGMWTGVQPTPQFARLQRGGLVFVALLDDELHITSRLALQIGTVQYGPADVAETDQFARRDLRFEYAQLGEVTILGS